MERARSRITAIGTTLALAVGLAVVAAAPAQADGYEDLLTDHLVEIHETVSDAGFVHPGVGLSAKNLRNAQEMVRSGTEPWASYFDATTQVRPWAGTSYTVDNMVRGKPDVPVTNTFTQGGMRGRMTRDSFGVLTQALLWVNTGDEAYRRNAIMGLRTWSNMNPDGYAYFPDAHIHTGKPLSQFLMAAEIIRATDPVPDDTPGRYGGYDVTWDAGDDEKLLTNFAEPIVNVFNFSNKKWMNQHNFGLYGRIATAIYADDVKGYAKGVEWFTKNSTYDGYDNGALGVQFQKIPADHGLNPYGYEFTQVREMGRDQAHAEANIDNFAALARFLDVQGTKVDPVDGTVSTADDAVSSYRFLGNRLLHGADAFYRFMMGAWTPWIDERETGGTISQAYRGRIFNPLSELYHQYTYAEGVDVEAEAPYLAELHRRMDGPFFRYGTGTQNFWAPGDRSVEYWVAFPPELAGTEPTPVKDTEVTFGRYARPLDDGTEIVTEDARRFARAKADEDGTTSVVSRLMYPGGSQMGVLVRTDGPATLEVLDKEQPSPLNPDETLPGTIARIELPDTQGEWRYITYPATGPHAHFYRVSGNGATVDLDAVMFDAGKYLTPPKFEQARDRYYLWAGAESSFDLSAADAGGSVAYTSVGLPEGASLDRATGALTWTPTDHDRGSHDVQIVADDGESVTARTFELFVARNRPKMIEAAIADGTDEDAVYTTVTREPFEAVWKDAKEASESGTDDEFRAAFEALLDAIDDLELLNPRLKDGSLDYTGAVTPTVLSDSGLRALADGDNNSHSGDLRVASFVLDFGTQYRVTAQEFGFRARFSFPMRSQGTNVYGSNDGISWSLLTERETSETNDWETIPVVAKHAGEKFRYVKLQVDHPGIPIDPAGPGIWSLGEFRIFGDRSEVAGTITDVSLTSPDALRERVTAGDTVDLAFSSPTPISDVDVTIGGQPVEATSEDGLTWSASTELGDVDGGALVPISIGHTTDDGETAATVLGSTDATQLYASDERNLVDLAKAAHVVDADGNADSGKSGHADRMLDANVGTFSDVAAVDGESDLIWDFGEGGTIELDRADFLVRQDNNGLTGMVDQVLEGSDDLKNWTRLTDPTVAELDWQNLDSLDESGFRYLRISNGNRINIAELRVFGDYRVELDAVIARAEAVDLSRYSRASAILFTRELEAVKAAAAKEGADRDALSKRLLKAWDLLEDPPSTIMPIERSWVTASSASWDGKRDAADNGWAMFDGDPSTFTDTKTATGWVRVVPHDGRTLAVATVRVQPRPGSANRANGFQVQGSNDGGTTWETFLTLSRPADSGWTEYSLNAPVSYKALRLYSPNGYTNLAELQFVRVPLDVTGLDLLLEETGGLSEADWTAASWADLTEAREAGLALRKTGANPTQAEVDAASDAIAAAVAALVAAE
ncbi:discoidin domain-containing protein [Streptomyces himalayensis]|uniref:Discoidin domain-containing protein n=1 Tax=Streptomyces himalayensis subsp. himalayensis TaxID=2756131 RepID=A0A7W0DI88_9ACTN|nr:discoidin domain-containing protein [Streptomyces himalayensis]MBA2945475.1 discoidin domain-containing protein [Streptomyces himalayensis subsp. himalayensis]